MACHPAVALELDALRAGSSGIIGPSLHCGIPHRTITSPVTVDGALWGYIAVAEAGRRLCTADKAAVERAAHTLAVALRARSRGLGSFEHAAEVPEVPSELNAATLSRGIANRGIPRDAPRLVCMIQRQACLPGPPLDAAWLEATFDQMYGSVKTIAMPNGDRGVALVVEQDDDGCHEDFVERTRTAVAATIEELGQEELIAVVSSVAHSVDDLARAHTECRQLLHCVTELCPPKTPPVAARDLGVGRLLLGTSDGPAMDRFVRSALAPLLIDDPKYTALLTTLHVFLESSRSPRLAGRKLDVHENTVRYRLAKACELTGLDVSGDLNDQLTVQVALLILRLQGRLPGIDVFGGLIDSEVTTTGDDVRLASVAAQ
jgi:hypothetical protein